MIVAPDMAQGAEASGRYSTLKGLLIAVWGLPAGVVAVLAGGFLGYTMLTKPVDPFAHKVAPSRKQK